MSTLRFTPISCADPGLLPALLKDEERSWMSELNWDYAPVRRILASFSEQRLLPGYIAVAGSGAVGYTYFLTHHSKGVIGTVYTLRADNSQKVADETLSLAIQCLMGTGTIRRIEAQIIPFNDLNLTEAFARHGFRCYPRSFLELDMRQFSCCGERLSTERIVPWDHSYLRLAAAVTLDSYRGQPDAQICQDYSTLQGCEGYLRSLVENPGCGLFLQEASFVGLDSNGKPCGFLIGSRIGDGAGMIPQVAILPSHQGHGLGKVLMTRALSYFKARNYRTVSLTVTRKNRRAFEWYTRLGFRVRKEFDAFVWER